MSTYQQYDYNSDVRKVSGIQFGVYSPEMIRNNSVVEIKTKDTMDGDIPKKNGLFDARMGLIDYHYECPTCKLKSGLCPGHFGHIELARPVFWPQFLGQVLKILKCFCIRCSKLLVDKNSPEVLNIINRKHGSNKFKAIYSLCQKSTKLRCEANDGSGMTQPYRFYK